MHRLDALKDKHWPTLKKLPNVNGIVRGKKIITGAETPEEVIRVLVKRKVPVTELKAKHRIPGVLDGTVETDVVEVGEIVAPPPFTEATERGKQLKRTDWWKEIFGALSIGGEGITAGTGNNIRTDRGIWAMTNLHVVMPDVKNPVKGWRVRQPGPFDKGQDSDTYATLEEWVPINFEGQGCWLAKLIAWGFNGTYGLFSRKTRLGIQQEPNYVDVAIAKSTGARPLRSAIIDIGEIGGMKNAEVGMKVKTSGRTPPEVSRGTITGLGATVQVSYGDTGVATFERQTISTKILDGGDSGSYVFEDTMDNWLIGLGFAGSKVPEEGIKVWSAHAGAYVLTAESISVINPIDLVFAKLNLQPIFGQPFAFLAEPQREAVL